jgi:hypothetical protein
LANRPSEEDGNQLLQLGRIGRTGSKHNMKQSLTLDWEKSDMGTVDVISHSNAEILLYV